MSVSTIEKPGLVEPANIAAETAPVKSSRKHHSFWNYLAWLPFIICLLPSALLLAFVPPNFNFSDSAALLTYDINALVPHWPAFYPLFMLFNKSISGYTDFGVYEILRVQHLTAIGGAMYLCSSCSGTWRRVVMAVLACTANYFFVFSHGLYTEAMSNAFLLYFIGAAARLGIYSETEIRRTLCDVFLDLPLLPQCKLFTMTQHRITLFVCFASLVLMTLTRYNMFVFAALLPGLYVMQGMVNASGKKLKPMFVAILLSVVALICVQLSSSFVCKAFDCDPTPQFGRPATYRLHELPWDTMPTAEKDHLQNNMRKHCPDDFSRLALTIMIRDGNPWIGSYRLIEALAPKFGTKMNVDKAMNDAAIAFFLTPNKYLASEVGRTFGMYMGESNTTFQSVVSVSTSSIPLYRKGVDIDQRMKNIPMIQNINVCDYSRIGKVINPSFFDACCQFIPLGLLAVSVSVLGVIAGGASRKSLAFVLTLFVSAILYSLLSAIVTEFVPRYLLPVNVAVWLMLAVSVVSFRKFPGVPTAKVGNSPA